MVVLCPTSSSPLVRKQMKCQLFVTAAIPCMALMGRKGVCTLGPGNIGIVIMRSIASELNLDLSRGLSALSWNYRKSDESASCVSLISHHGLRTTAIDPLCVGYDIWWCLACSVLISHAQIKLTSNNFYCVRAELEVEKKIGTSTGLRWGVWGCVLGSFHRKRWALNT